MDVFVFCEFSDTVSAAFRARGHDVLSCDLLPSENPDANHYQGDGRHLLQEPWDLVIAHPPCTYLSVARGKPSDDDEAILEALEFFADCQNANAPMVAVENPRIYRFAQAVLGKPSQVVQPWHFGDEYLKRTHWWLKGLPPLLATHFSHEDGSLPVKVAANSTKGSRRKTYQTAEFGNPALRSKFHPGMAAAMVQQWGG